MRDTCYLCEQEARPGGFLLCVGCYERLNGVNVEPLKMVDAGTAGEPRKRGFAESSLDVVRDLFEALVGLFVGRGRPCDAQVERGCVAREGLFGHVYTIQPAVRYVKKGETLGPTSLLWNGWTESSPPLPLNKGFDSFRETVAPRPVSECVGCGRPLPERRIATRAGWLITSAGCDGCRVEPTSNCPDCWKGKPIPCAVGCRDTDECCDKSLAAPCERCGGTGTL